MFSHTKKEELEFENSDRQLFGSNNTNFENNYLEKLSESELALWPLVPLTNFAKDAYKNDNIYMGKNFGDEAPEEMMSEDNEKKPEGLDIIYEKANQNNETNGASGQATQTMIPLKTQMTTKESYFLSDHSFSPIELYWEKLTIKASYKQKKRRCPPCCNYEKKTKNILNEVTGIAKPGSFTAILGPSGSGKTTLLNFLSSRMMSENLSFSGDLKVNGVSVENIDKIGNQVAYVMQDDILLATFTPVEAFWFCAELRMKATHEEKKKKIESLIKVLGLQSCQNTIIGNTMLRGISGGERKRTSIGVELLTNPSLIFLDEPTTGLDSETSFNIVSLLGTLANNGRTVISTIHQPSSNIFMLFDKLILLVEGNVIYQGDANKSLDYFDKIGYSAPQFCNPSTFFMKCMNPEGLLVEDMIKKGDYSIKLTDEIKLTFKHRVQKLIDHYQNSEEVKAIKPQTTESLPVDTTMNTVSWFKQVYKISERGFRNEFRNPLDVRMKLFSSIFFGIVNIIVFSGLGSYTSEIQNRTGCIFTVCMNLVFSSMFANLMTFGAEKPLFIREKMNRTYTLNAYFWGRTSCEFPMHVLYATIGPTMVYFAVGLNQVYVYKYFIFILIQNVTYFAGVSYGFFMAAVFTNPEMAMALVPVIIIPFMVMAGFFVNQNSIPYFFYPYEYLSTFKYNFQPAIINEFSDKIWYCAPHVQCDPLRMQNFAEGMWTCIWVLAIIGVGLRFLACVILMKKSTPKRPKLMKAGY